ncbi:mitochondrial ribosomal protein L39 isoform X2 [Lycorma delicatula]|uniref:mitochondrial ribosomal protein L39 isoform X2 n=1 Tax=Lycorma delicatula TaxID=130591 RepID=UPI003F513277
MSCAKISHSVSRLARDQRLHHASRTIFRSRSTASPSANLIESKKRRNDIFNSQIEIQKERIGRIEKINVLYKGLPKETELVLNKYISTPYNVAQHLSQWVVKRGVLALVDDLKLWDMHRPLESDCSVQFLNFDDKDPFHVNKAFWRTCSFLLGAVVDNAFKDNISVTLHSFPSPNVKSGSFVYDVKLGLDDWEPTHDELRMLSAEFVSLARKGLILERLEVTADTALDMFADNAFKVEQIPDIASSNPGNMIVLYRVADHIDISRGPMIANTEFIGRATISAVHQLQTDLGKLYRFQGVALPTGILLNHFAYGILEERAKKLSGARLPGQAEQFLTPPVRSENC